MFFILSRSFACQIMYKFINFYSFFLSNCLPLISTKWLSTNNERKNHFFINPATQFFFNYINIVQKMQVIINQGVKKYGEQEELSPQQLSRYVESHPFYRVSMKDLDVVGRLWSALKKKNELGSRGQSEEQQYKKKQSLEQLGLYLNRQNNAQIFKLFEYILNNPKGLTYEQLSKRLKTDIITISHYCCKLKKLRLIDWDHEKDGVIVFPKATAPERPDVSIVYSINKNQSNYDVKESFLFRELSMTENIWINISSEDSIARGGLTNEEIKRKIMKHAENKMVRRTVESMKFFEKTAERQGKVFEFKYKNETDQIKQEINRKNSVDESDEIESLDQLVLEWLKKKFPEFIGQSFLNNLINNKFKDYFSSLGVKQSKRQCTPLKLNRYIKVLNYLHKEGGMKESELRNLIVRDQAQFNIGIMHKRSLMGILEGLKNLQILLEDDGFYYPGWIEIDNWTKRKEELFPKKIREEYEETPKKKVHLEGSDQKSKKRNKKSAAGDNEKTDGKYTKITEAQYQLELFSTLLTVQIEKALKRCYRKAFHRIIYVQRRKAVTKYIPQNHILHLLENPLLMPSFSLNQSLSTFYQELDQIVEDNSIRQNIQCQPENELIKFIRKNPIKNSNFLRIKYGKSWPTKFEELTKEGIISMNEQGIKLIPNTSFLI